jgi:hypothetical protein
MKLSKRIGRMGCDLVIIPGKAPSPPASDKAYYVIVVEFLVADFTMLRQGFG